MKKVIKQTTKKYLFVWSVLIYPTILFLIFYVGVNLNSFALAFQKIDAVTSARTWIWFDNFKLFFKMLSEDLQLQRSVINSLKTYILCFVISFPLMILFSFYVYKNFFLSKVFRLVLMVPAVVSSFIMGLLFQKFVQVGMPAFFLQYFDKEIPNFMRDSRYTFGTTIFYAIWISFSSSILLIPNAMKEVPEEVIESAELDGVGFFKELWFMTIPLISPTLTTLIVVGISGIFSNVGPVHMFYMYSAYPEVYNVGYYILVKTMTESTYTLYPQLATMGIMFTLVLAPVTIAVKVILEKYSPFEERKKKNNSKAVMRVRRNEAK